MTEILSELVSAIRVEVRAAAAAEERARRVAEALAPFLCRADLVPSAQLEPDPAGYRQHVLYVEPDGSFSVVALVWLPGQETSIHDHTSWCVVGTHLGAEEETVYRLDAGADRTVLLPIATTVHPAGAVTWVTPPGDVHRVRNAATATAVSLHVYGVDVSLRGTSIRRTYDQPVLTTAASTS